MIILILKETAEAMLQRVNYFTRCCVTFKKSEKNIVLLAKGGSQLLPKWVKGGRVGVSHDWCVYSINIHFHQSTIT